MENLLNHLEQNLLLIKSENSAFSLSVKNNLESILLNVILNSEDNESLIISTFVKLLTDYCLMNDIKYAYHICVDYIEECTEIEFYINIK